MEQQLIGGVGMTSSLIGLGTWAMGGWMWGGGDDAEAIKGGWVAYRKPRRKRRLDGLEGLLAERFRQARASMCNAWRSGAIARSMVGSDTATPCSRTKSWRTTSQLPRCCVRFETPPGKQLQIDFGERRVVIGGEPVRVYLFVATLGYSRRIFVRAFRHERQSAWFDGMEGAFRHFGGMPQEVLLDNARALVEHHDPATREVRFNERLLAFARYSGIRARACAPAARIKSDLTDSSMIRRVGRPSLSELVL